MVGNFQKYKRRSIRLLGYDYSQNGAYFVTFCVQNKECLLGHIKNGEMVLNAFGQIVDDVWKSLPKKFQNIECNEYIIMPNHVHGIIGITARGKHPIVGAIHELPLQRRNMLLPKIIGYFKMNTSKRINVLREMAGVRLWQRNYYEHVIRNENDYFAIAQYILNNPMKWEMDEYYLS